MIVYTDKAKNTQEQEKFPRITELKKFTKTKIRNSISFIITPKKIKTLGINIIKHL